jgi:hypothetical protein
MRKRKRVTLLPIIILLVLLCILPVIIFFFGKRQELQGNAAGVTPFLYGSIDTMKETKDTGTNQLTDAQIAADLQQYASLNNNYISISVPYDFSDYFGRWVSAIRKTGKHIWFRSHWNQWENDYGTTGVMQPSTYLANMDTFIRQNPTFFQSGDIFDGCAECENGKYWGTTQYFDDDYNKMLMDLTKTADAAFQAIGVSGIDTRVHSMNGTIAEKNLYPATVQYMGKVTTDSYVNEGTGVLPADHAAAEKAELDAIYAKNQVPVILGEYGYCTGGDVSDAQQQQVLKVVFDMLQTLPYLQGVNYWVGYGGNTAVFSGDIGNLSFRPAANDLAAFFANRLQQTGPLPTLVVSGQPTVTNPVATVFPSPTPPYVSPTLYCLGACSTSPTPLPTIGQNPLPTQGGGLPGQPSIAVPTNVSLPPGNTPAPGRGQAPGRQNFLQLLLKLLQQLIQLLGSLFGQR